jgi:outer membrane protein assembly factor BamB
MLFTQEQRGKHEAVVCYAADTGEPIWMQHVESRFDEAMGGPGPRATPTLAAGALYAQGANGIIQRLDPTSGDVIWTKDLRKLADRQPPMWGFSSSPLVVGSVVIVYAGGKDDKGTWALDVETGETRWSVAAGDHSYCSPQLSVVGNQEVVLMLTNAGLNILDPRTGKERLNYKWPNRGYRSLQPQVIDGNSILLPTGPDAGTRRIKITETKNGMTAKAMWTSRHFRPEFSDLVVHEDYAYGFDGAIFTCIDLANGKRKWKGGRYGKGQVLLLADSNLLLVAGEYGDVVLLKAEPSGHRELTKFHAIDGKTWNHPVVVGDRLYVRNSKEAACYRLPLLADKVADSN